MKIFHKGKLINPYGKGKKLEGRTKKDNGILIAKYKFDKFIYENLVPEFNAEVTNYKIVDEYLDTENIVTRTIYSSELPTLMKFGTSSTSDKANSLLEVYYLNVDNVNNMSLMFKYCSNLTSVNSSDWNISKVNNMKEMFFGCSSLTSLDVSNWDTSNVTNMGSMFNNCISLIKLEMKNWKINKDSQLASMFSKCSSLTELDLSSWENLPFMIYNMFYGCKKLTTLNLNNICINEEPYMSNYYFYECESLNNITMQNSDYSSVNKIISVLPTRTSDSMGTLNVAGIDDISQVDMATAQSKCWNIIDNSYFILGKSKLGQDKLK